MSETKKQFSIAQFYSKFGMFFILIVLFIVASVASPNFLTQTNLTNVLRQITVVTILACGCSFVIISGNINIGYDGILVCVGCGSAMVYAATQNLFIAVIAGIAFGVIFGIGYGVFVTTFKIPGFIVGLAMTSIGSGIILLATGGNKVPKTELGNFSVIGQGYVGPIPICVIIMIGVLIVCHIILKKSRFGMKVMAVGGNREAAVTSGINVNKVIRQVFILDGICCAIGAIIFMSRLNSGDPAAGGGICFDAITAACVGGVSIAGGEGSITGSFIGAIIVGIIDNLLNLMNVNANFQDIVSGVVIIVAIVVDVSVKRAIANNVKKAVR
jgi:inositol transport system permease protein